MSTHAARTHTHTPTHSYSGTFIVLCTLAAAAATMSAFAVDRQPRTCHYSGRNGAAHRVVSNNTHTHTQTRHDNMFIVRLHVNTKFGNLTDRQANERTRTRIPLLLGATARARVARLEWRFRACSGRELRTLCRVYALDMDTSRTQHGGKWVRVCVSVFGVAGI